MRNGGQVNEPHTRTTGPRAVASASLVIFPSTSASEKPGAGSPTVGDVVAKLSNGEACGAGGGGAGSCELEHATSATSANRTTRRAYH